MAISSLLRMVLLSAVAMVPLSAGCAEDKMDGKSVDQVFPDSKVVSLIEAADRGDAKAVKTLIESGADVNFRGYRSITPLSWMLVRRNVRGAELLLQHGANPNHREEGGFTPVWIAAGGQTAQMLELLLQHGGDPNVWVEHRSVLISAIESDRWDNVDILLTHGADINAVLNSSRTAAIAAATVNRYDKVVYLLERGYSHDLEYLARYIDSHELSEDSAQFEWKQKALRVLKDRGVTFPLQPKPMPLPKTRERPRG